MSTIAAKLIDQPILTDIGPTAQTAYDPLCLASIHWPACDMRCAIMESAIGRNQPSVTHPASRQASTDTTYCGDGSSITPTIG